MLSNGTRGLAFSAYFELLLWGTFPVFTQRTSCHFITRRFTYFYRTRTSGGFPRIYTDLSYCQHSPFLKLALSGEFLPAFVKARGTQRNSDLRVISALSILGNFPVYQLAHRIKRGPRLPRDLCLSPGHFSVPVSAPVLAKGTNGSPFSPCFPDSHVTGICVYRTYGTGETFPEISSPVSLPHDRSLGLSPINITRSGFGLSRGRRQGGPFPALSAKGSTGQAA